MSTTSATSPLFNNLPIFNSVDSSGNSYTEGCLYVPSYAPITQAIHFEGEIGNYTLYHGYPDMEWVFEGIISGHTQRLFNTAINAILTAIDTCATGTNGTYQTLVDSFGNYYDNAQIRNLTYTQPPHAWGWTNTSGTLEYGYLARVKITGIIQGNTHLGATT